MEYIYENTPDRDDSELRDMIITYAATKAEELVKHATFMDMLKRNGEIGARFAFCVTGRLTSKDVA